MTLTVKIIIAVVISLVCFCVGWVVSRFWAMATAKKKVEQMFGAMGSDIRNVVSTFAANVGAQAQDKETSNVTPKIN